MYKTQAARTIAIILVPIAIALSINLMISHLYDKPRPSRILANGIQAYEVHCDDMDKTINGCRIEATKFCGGEFHEVYPVLSSTSPKPKSMLFACPKRS